MLKLINYLLSLFMVPSTDRAMAGFTKALKQLEAVAANEAAKAEAAKVAITKTSEKTHAKVAKITRKANKVIDRSELKTRRIDAAGAAAVDRAAHADRLAKRLADFVS